MPTNQPSNTNPGDAPKPRDDANAAAVMADEQLDDAPGGGGLGGAAAANPLGGSGRTPVGTSPNSPIDVPMPDATDARDAEDSNAAAESRVQAVDADAPEPHPSSQ